MTACRRGGAVLAMAAYLMGWPCWAAEYYIAPGGSNVNPGTLDSPWGTFQFAIDQLNPGDTLFVRGGTYNLSSRVVFGTGDGGATNNPVKVWAYESGGVMESPILDFSAMPTSLWGQSSGRGIQIESGVDWVHLKGLTEQNARDNGVYTESNFNLFERLTTRWNGDSGTQLHGTAAHNLILNWDSYENYDPYTIDNGVRSGGLAPQERVSVLASRPR